MTRLFYAVIALALLATSCSKDDAATADGATKNKTVTFSVQIPQMQTRAYIFGNGRYPYTFLFAFYDDEGNILPKYSNLYKTESDPDDWVPGWRYRPADGTFRDRSGNTAEIKVTLVEGRTYHALFWAYNTNANYTPDLINTKTVTCNYRSTDLPDQHDAFYARLEGITTAKPQNANPIILKRPFALLEIGASEADIKAGLEAGDTVRSQAIIAKVPTKLDLMTDKVSEKETVVFGWTHNATADITQHQDTVVYNGVKYPIISATFILAGIDDTDKSLETITLKMSEKEFVRINYPDWTDEQIKEYYNEYHNDAVARTFYSIPIQRNYRTYVLGENIITSGELEYTVSITPGFNN